MLRRRLMIIKQIKKEKEIKNILWKYKRSGWLRVIKISIKKGGNREILDLI